MMLERRSDTGEPVSPPPEKNTGSGGKKPVIVYILVLFAVAFLLMIWSLISHQRSNTEAIGRLRSRSSWSRSRRPPRPPLPRPGMKPARFWRNGTAWRRRSPP